MMRLWWPINANLRIHRLRNDLYCVEWGAKNSTPTNQLGHSPQPLQFPAARKDERSPAEPDRDVTQPSHTTKK